MTVAARTPGGSSGRRPWVVRAVIVVVGIALLGLQGYGIYRVVANVYLPFPGFVLSRDLVVAQLNQPYWPGIRAGLRPGDWVTSIDGRPLGTASDLTRIVRTHPAGTVFRYTVARRGHGFEIEVPSLVFRTSDFVVTFGILAITAMAFLGMGSLIGWIRADVLGAGIYGFSATVAFAMGISPDYSWAATVPVAAISRVFLAAGILHFALVFPEPGPTLRRRPWLALLPYLAATPLAIGNYLAAGSVTGSPAVSGWWGRWITFTAAATLLVALLDGLVRTRGDSRVVGERVRITRWGLALAVAGFAVGFLGSEFGVIPSAPTSVFVVPAWIWLGTIALASLRDDVFDLGTRARETLVRPAVLGLLVVFYLLLLAATSMTFRRARLFPSPMLPLGFLAAAVLLVEPLRRLARAIVRWGMRAPRLLPPRILRERIEEIASSLEETAIADRVLGLADILPLARVRLFLERGDTWVDVRGSLRLGADHPLVRGLRTADSGVSAADLDRRAAEGRAPRGSADTLRTLGVTTAFPLRSRGATIGFLGLAAATRDGAIDRDDFTALSTLAGQVAVALENARVFRRIRELDDDLRAENVVLKQQLSVPPSLEGLVGKSPRMREVYERIEQVAPTDTTVLLRGETGTGKELVARAIHARSSRRDRPMIRVNCAAVPPSLIESEFFGHERGAFTGAVSRKVGRFELAAGGTIFLDEIGDLPLELQPKLLRVLQEREFERVGGSSTLRVDVRVITATNRDLDALVRQGRFREDLFFRLNVFPIVVPPLRERREDIPALAAHLIQRYAAKVRRRITSIDDRSLRALTGYDWPGNVRELENLIERAVVLSAGERLVIREVQPAETEPARRGLRPLSEILREVKVETIRRALSETSGNQAHAAMLLRLKPSSLSRMMKSLGLRE